MELGALAQEVRAAGWNTLRVLCLWLALIEASLSAQTFQAAPRRTLAETSPAETAGLVAIGQLPATNRLRLTLSLPLRQRAALASLLTDIYDPASANYRHYLTPEQFAERFGPAKPDYEALREFARTNGFTITGEHPNRTLLNVSATVADLERVFQTTLRVYPHPTEARSFYGPETPPSIAGQLPVLDLSGLNNYHLPRPKSLHTAPAEVLGHATPKSGSGPRGTYLGTDFRAAYVPGVTLTGAGQMVGLLEFDGYYVSDIVAYENQAGLPAVPLQNVLIDGFGGVPAAQNNNSSEVSLDIEMAASMAPGLAGIIVYEGPTDGTASNDILNRMTTDNLAKQLSCSWDFLSATAGSTDQIFQQMAAQGQSFFDASGDNGAYTGFISPPNDDPYITVVGGTTLTTGSGGAWSSETVWNWYTSGAGTGASGGGISTTYPIPDWQAGISMSANQGSTSKRNIPDVAMTADNVWVVYNNGTKGAFGGTSCSAPLWAGFTALVNQQAVAASGTTVGFLNPSLYAIGKSSAYTATFHDIKTGNSFPKLSSTKFVAVAGYDLCTGWGTPTGQSLINALAARANSLLVTPATGFTTTGPVGGPFSPASQTFSLTNFGTAAVNWSIVNTNSWLTASPSYGTLTPGSPSTTITVALNSAANLQTAGVYPAGLQVSNLTAGVALQTGPFILLAGQSIVLNSGFETGDFAQWTLQGSTLDNHGAGSTSLPAHPELVHSGSYGALLGEVGSLAYLSQTLSTVPGQYYLLSFWVTSPYFTGTTTPNEFQVAWNVTTNSSILLFDQVNLAPFNWTNMQFIVSASGTSTVLQFGARDDPQAFGLDDVSVAPVNPPRFQGVTSTKSGVTLTWVTLPGLIYQLQYTTNLLGGNWNLVGAAITATNTLTTVIDVQPTDQHRFYRVVLAQ